LSYFYQNFASLELVILNLILEFEVMVTITKNIIVVSIKVKFFNLSTNTIIKQFIIINFFIIENLINN